MIIFEQLILKSNTIGYELCFPHYSHYLILISIIFKLTKYRITKVLQGCSTVFYYANVLSILSKKCSSTKSTSNNLKKKNFVRCRFGPFSQHSPHMGFFR